MVCLPVTIAEHPPKREQESNKKKRRRSWRERRTICAKPAGEEGWASGLRPVHISNDFVLILSLGQEQEQNQLLHHHEFQEAFTDLPGCVRPILSPAYTLRLCGALCVVCPDKDDGHPSALANGGTFRMSMWCVWCVQWVWWCDIFPCQVTQVVHKTGTQQFGNST